MHRFLLALSLALAAIPTLFAQEKKAEAPKKDDRPNVEVVFCLDTTGSMGGLINAAKTKIWTISNQIASGKPTPRVKVGLVAFRDRGDAYVTKITDLTEDLDGIYTTLMEFKAQGGGDFPESVNQALNESVTKISWSKDSKTLRMIFLVGDAPPHMDYADDVKYPETCKLAVEKSIIINTIQCGNHPETKKHWETICKSAEGSYVQIDQGGGPVVAVATPFDADLAKINSEISAKTLVYGDRHTQLAGENKKAANAALAPTAAAERAGFLGRDGAAATYDLLRNLDEGKVKLDQLKKDELPPELQKLNTEEQKEYLGNLRRQREELATKANELNRKRAEFLVQKQKESTNTQTKDGFDNQVLRILQTQAGRQNIRYEGVVEEKK